jgi:hypothetical protein
MVCVYAFIWVSVCTYLWEWSSRFSRPDLGCRVLPASCAQDPLVGSGGTWEATTSFNKVDWHLFTQSCISWIFPLVGCGGEGGRMKWGYSGWWCLTAVGSDEAMDAEASKRRRGEPTLSLAERAVPNLGSSYSEDSSSYKMGGSMASARHFSIDSIWNGFALGLELGGGGLLLRGRQWRWWRRIRSRFSFSYKVIL